MLRGIVVLLLLASADAHAEGPWGIVAAGGPALHRVNNNGRAGEYMLGASADLDVGYRIVDRALFGAAAGAHLGLAYARGHETTAYDEMLELSYAPIEIGLSVQLAIADRAMIAPWFGIVDRGSRTRSVAGIDVAFDIDVFGDERISVVATYARTPRVYDGIESFSAGIAYRYW